MDIIRVCPGDAVSFVGAGGKTSLLFLLAEAINHAGWSVLLTTTTRMHHPEPGRYDHIDIRREAFRGTAVSRPGRYFAARPGGAAHKVTSLDRARLKTLRERFDITLIEADGAAMKPLKGWRASEPVVPDFTTLTVGVLDISTVGGTMDSGLIHRLELFNEITESRPGDRVSVDHLVRLVEHPDGLFRHAVGEKRIFVNKVETEEAALHFTALQSRLAVTVVGGSVFRNTFIS